MNKKALGLVAIGLIAANGLTATPVVGPNLSAAAPAPAGFGLTADPLAAVPAVTAPAADTHAMAAGIVTPPSAPIAAYAEPEMSHAAFRELRDAITVPRLLKPRVLVVKNLNDQVQFQAIGAPIAPIPGESRASRDQARFPLFIIAW